MRLRKFVAEHGSRPALLLPARPFIHAQRHRAVAIRKPRLRDCLFVARCRIERQEVVGPRPELRLRLAAVIVETGHGAKAAERFIAGEPYDERDIRLLSIRKDLFDRSRQKISIPNGAHARGAGGARQREHTVGSESAHVFDGRGVPDFLDADAVGLRVGKRGHAHRASPADQGAAHAHGPIEQALGQRAGFQGKDRHRPRRLPDDGNVVRIAAEPGDVVANPLQRRDLVEQAIVAGRPGFGFRRKLRMGEKSQRPEPVIEIDDDDVVLRQVLAAVKRHAGRAHEERTAVDEDDDRRVGQPGLRPDIEVEAVLAHHLGAGILVGHDAAQRLHALRPETVRMTHCGPALGRGRRTPAKFANRRRRVRNAEIGIDTGIERDTVNRTAGRSYGSRAIGRIPLCRRVRGSRQG